MRLDKLLDRPDRDVILRQERVSTNPAIDLFSFSHFDLQLSVVHCFHVGVDVVETNTLVPELGDPSEGRRVKVYALFDLWPFDSEPQSIDDHLHQVHLQDVGLKHRRVSSEGFQHEPVDNLSLRQLLLKLFKVLRSFLPLQYPVLHVFDLDLDNLEPEACDFVHVLLVLLLVRLPGHVVVRFDVEQTHFEGHCRVLNLQDFFDAHALDLFFGRQLGLFELSQVALLSDDPGHAVDAQNELLASQEAPEHPLNVHDVAVDHLSSPQKSVHFLLSFDQELADLSPHLLVALGAPPAHPLENDLLDFAVSQFDPHCFRQNLELANDPEQKHSSPGEAILLVLQTVSTQISLSDAVHEAIHDVELKHTFLDCLLLLAQTVHFLALLFFLH